MGVAASDVGSSVDVEKRITAFDLPTGASRALFGLFLRLSALCVMRAKMAVPITR